MRSADNGQTAVVTQRAVRALVCEIGGAPHPGKLLVQVGTARPRRVCTDHAQYLAVCADSLCVDCQIVGML